MQPRTSVRQPVIAGARPQQLSELLRQWRRQPRKRSPLLFWALLSLALMSDGGLLFLATRLVGVWGFSLPPVEPLAYENHPGEQVVARPALYLSLLAAGFFVSGAAVRLRRPQWGRRLLLAGVLTALGCLGWSVSSLFAQTIPEGTAFIAEGGQGFFWPAVGVMVLGLLLALLFRDDFLALTGTLLSSLGFLVASCWPSAFAELCPPLPQGTPGDICLNLQVVMLLSAYAALALTWGTVALTMARVLMAAPSSERLRRSATLSLWIIHLAVLFLAGSALLDGWRAIPGILDPALRAGTHGWSAQAFGTLLVLPGCIALIYARRRGWLPPFRCLATVMLGFTFLAMIGYFAVRWETGVLHIEDVLSAGAGFYISGLFPLSLTTHAALRYYFGRQRILDA